MDAVCTNFVFVICAVLLVKRCDPAVTINSTPENVQDYTPVSTVCTIPDGNEGYCVSIHNCITLLESVKQMKYNENTSEFVSNIAARKCGPRNRKSSNPFVCCEKNDIQLPSTSPSLIIGGITQSTSEEVVKVSNVRPTRPSHSEESTSSDQPYQSCGTQAFATRILGGEPASEMEFPWLGRLLRRDGYGDFIFSCTGSLIAPKVVLTTAHCLVSPSLQNIGALHSVSLGEHTTECDSGNECLLNKKTVRISKYVAHSEYKVVTRNHDNDIGLVFLSREVKYTNFILPICLLRRSIEASEYHVAGWGKTETGSVSGVKLKTTLPPYSWEQCTDKYRTIKVELTPRQICAGGVQGTDSCQGDSGGPLMVQDGMRWYVAGVVSFGLSCGRKGWPAVYAYVPSYIDWLKKTVNETI